MATKTTKTIETIVYVGKCPKCGKEKTSAIEAMADSICGDCIMKENDKKFREQTEHLIGAKIISVDGMYYSSIVIPRYDVESIVVLTTDSRQFVITGMAYNEDEHTLEIEEVQPPMKVTRDIKDILQHCAKLRGVSGLSWRTMHEFFWFVSACKWGVGGGHNREEHAIYEEYSGRPVGMRTSFDEMLTEWVLLFEEYCVDEYGELPTPQ